jgi:hypothetical protein
MLGAASQRRSPRGSGALKTKAQTSMPMGMPFGSGVQGKIVGPKYGKGNY